MTNLTKNLKQTNSDLLMLLVSANFDKSRIIIADHELSENFLTLYLEDKEDFKSDLSETLMYKMPISQFSDIIATEKLNSYAGIKYSEHDRPYDAQIEINSPIAWYNNDATLYQQKECLNTVLEYVLKSLVKGGLSC